MVPLNETVYFDVVTNSPTGGQIQNADATPTFSVYEEATDTALVNYTNTAMNLRSGKTGLYRGSFTANDANGFHAGSYYSVVAQAIVDTVVGQCVALSFRISAPESSIGSPDVNVTGFINKPVLMQGANVSFPTGLASPTNITNASGIHLDPAESVNVSGLLSKPVVVEGTNVSFPTLVASRTNITSATGIGLVAGQTIGTVTNAVTMPSTVRVDVTGVLAKPVLVEGANISFPTGIASRTNITSATGIGLAANQNINTVTTLTNLPAITTSWLTSLGTNEDFVVRIQSGILTSIASIGTAGGAALSMDVTADNTTGLLSPTTTAMVGTPTNTYASTSALDGTKHIVSHATAPSIVYEFDCGGGTSPVGFIWTGYVGDLPARTVTMYAWNFNTTDWEALGTIDGGTSTENIVKNIVLYARHMGDGSSAVNKPAGKIFLKFTGTSANSTTINTDQIYATYSVTSRTVGYADGAVWVKQTGTSGTETFVNGTADNPCPWSDALVIANSLGISRFRILNGETVTLSASIEHKTLIGKNWALELGGQYTHGAYIEGAVVSGTASGTSGAMFKECWITNDVSVPPSDFDRCGIAAISSNPFVGNYAGQYNFIDCFSLVAGSATPGFSFAGAGSNTTINLRRWSGGSSIILDNDCTLSLEVSVGGGQTITTGGANVEIRGITRSATIHISGDSTVQINAVIGPITIDGSATAAVVNIHGVCGVVSNSATNTTITNTAVSLSNTAGMYLAANQHVIVDSGTVTTLTNLPSIPSSWLTSAGTNADFITRVQSGLATPTNITNASGIHLDPAQSVNVSGLLSKPIIIEGSNVSFPTGLASRTNITSATGIGLVAGQTIGTVTNAVTMPSTVRVDVTGVLAKPVLVEGANISFPTGLASRTNITSATGIGLAANQHVVVDSGVLTTLTNLPAITASWLTVNGVHPDLITLIKSGLTANITGWLGETPEALYQGKVRAEVTGLSVTGVTATIDVASIWTYQDAMIKLNSVTGIMNVVENI
jgi:hypothetical protein